MVNRTHDFHLHIQFMVYDSILHETSFLELLCGVGNTIKLCCDLVHNSKGAFTNVANLVVFVSTLPLSNDPTN